MEKKVGQICWYRDGSNDNNPRSITLSRFRAGTIFPKSYPIVKLEVQTLPNVEIYINAHPNPVKTDAEGKLLLDVQGLTKITSVNFSNASLKRIADNSNASILINYVYEAD